MRTAVGALFVLVAGCAVSHLEADATFDEGSIVPIDAGAPDAPGPELDATAEIDGGAPLDAPVEVDGGAPLDAPRVPADAARGPCEAWPVPEPLPPPTGPCGSCAGLCGAPFDGCGERLSCGACEASAMEVWLQVRNVAYDGTRDEVVATTYGMGVTFEGMLVGLEPTPSALSWTAEIGVLSDAVVVEPNGGRAWVATNFTTDVRSVDLATHEAGPPVGVGTGTYGALLFIPALTRLPSGAVVAAGFDSGDGSYPVLAIFDEGTARPRNRMPVGWRSGSALAAVADDLVVGLDPWASGGAVGSFIEVDDDGIVCATDVSGLFAHGDTSITFDGRWVVGSGGTIVEPRSRTLVGRVRPDGASTLEAAIADRASNRLYAALADRTASGRLVLVAFDLARRLEVGRVEVAVSAGSVRRILVRPGRGLVVLTYPTADAAQGIVTFVDTTLVPR